jgi:thiamine biosynthesis protein ThiS
MREGDDVFETAPTAPGARSATVVVNGTPHPWRLGLTVADVLRERGTDEEFVATAVNTRFVPRIARLETPLWPDDRLVVFAAIVGG